MSAAKQIDTCEELLHQMRVIYQERRRELVRLERKLLEMPGRALSENCREISGCLRGIQDCMDLATRFQGGPGLPFGASLENKGST